MTAQMPAPLDSEVGVRYTEVRAALAGFAPPRVVIGGGVSDSVIDEAEQVLGMRIPDQFRDFLREFGWLEVGSEELFGLGDDIPAYLNLVDVTKDERTQLYPLTPHHLLPVLNNGRGDVCCVDCRAEADSRMVWWNHDSPAEELRLRFAEWLTDLVQRALNAD